MQIRRGIKPITGVARAEPGLRAVQIRRGIKLSGKDNQGLLCLRAVQIRRGIKLISVFKIFQSV